MKNIIKITALSLAISLAACGDSDTAETPTTPQEATPAVEAPETSATPAANQPLTEVQVEEFRGNFEEAMAAIPPESRESFQKVWNCELKKPEAQRDNLDASWVIKKTQELKANPAIANC